MPERHSIYVSDEEVNEFIEQYGDVVGGDSRLFVMGIKHLMTEKREALEQLKAQSGLDEMT